MPTSADVAKIVREAAAEVILPAIASVEKVGEVDVSVVRNLGVGIGDASTFADCVTKDEKTAWLQAYANAIYDADKEGMKRINVPPTVVGAAPRLAARKFAIVRMLRCLVAPSSSGATASPGSITVIAKTEEEHSYSQDFPGSELESQQQLCASYYARPFHTEFVPKLAVLKRFCYSIKVDHKLPSLTRVPLSSLRANSFDSTFIMFKRWCVGACIVSVGMSPPHGFAADGFGDVNGTTLWLSWWDCLDLLDTLETQIGMLSEAGRTSVIESVVSIIAGATGQGSPRVTASCAIGRAVSDTIRIVSSAAVVQAEASRKRKSEEGDDPKMGPNGLERMKGGNPAGEPCKDFIKGRCPRAMCSFSHVPPAGPPATEQ